MSTQKIIANRIKESRKHKGITQHELAKLVNTSQQTINKLESGDVRHSKYLHKIAEATNVSFAWLSGEDNNQTVKAEDIFGLPENFAMIPILTKNETININETINYFREPEFLKSKGIVVNTTLWPTVDKNCFGVIIEDRALLYSFRPGDIVIINPILKPDPGDIVLAKFKNNSDVVIRKYRVTSVNADKNLEHVDLIAFNEDFPTISYHQHVNLPNGDDPIIGPAVMQTKLLSKRNVSIGPSDIKPSF